MLTRAVVTVFLAAAAVEGQTKVKVRFYGESQCPPCKQAMQGPVNQTLTAEGIWGIMDYDYIPWGNAYFETKECGGGPYNVDARQCWDRTCGGDGKQPAADCFKGDIVCQHASEGECYGNIAENCAKNVSTGPQQWAPFMYCWEPRHDIRNSSLERCAEQAGLSASAITSCANGPLGQTLIVQAAKTTAAIPGGHPGTPYITVNDRALQNPDNLLSTVCREWKGTEPAGCRRYL